MSQFRFVLNKFVLSFGLALMTFVSAYAADWGHRGVLIDGIYYMNNGDASVYVNFYDDSTVPSEVIIPETITVEGQNYTVESVRRLDSDKIVSVTLPSTITSIEVSAFNDCDNLTTVDLSHAKTTIGETAFFFCRNLVSVLNCENVISIGDYAFGICENLCSISLGNSLVSIGSYSFELCYSLSSLSLGNSLEIIGDYAFYVSGLTSIEIPNTVNSIGEYAFAGCELLSSVVLPNSLKSLEECTFYDCLNLSSVVLPSSLDSIKGGAFTESGIEEVIIPDGVKYIGEMAFGNCNNLQTVFIPKSVEQIELNAFFNYSGLSDITIEEGNPAYLVEDGILYNAEKTRILQGINAQMKCSYSFASSVETIDEFAFYACDKLTSVVLPSSLKVISKGAFCGCINLSSVVIPASVYWINNEAFSDCYKLSSVVSLNPTPPVLGGEYVFYKVPETCTVHVLNESVDKYKSHSGWAVFNIVGDAEDYSSIDKISLENIVISNANGQVIIKGVSAGDVVTLYSASGTQLASVVAEDSSVCIDESIPSGTFIIVSINGRNKKVVF